MESVYETSDDEMSNPETFFMHHVCRSCTLNTMIMAFVLNCTFSLAIRLKESLHHESRTKTHSNSTRSSTRDKKIAVFGTIFEELSWLDANSAWITVLTIANHLGLECDAANSP